MNEQEYTSVEQIDKVYHDHIESLELSGLPFDRTGLIAEWAAAVEDFKANQSSGPDYKTL